METYEWFLGVPLIWKSVFVLDVLGMSAILVIVLAELFSWGEQKYQESKFRYDFYKNKEMNARVDEMISAAQKR
ncbi:hypothetical protein LCGC14_2027300, partial [marine sediment metagenome]